MKTGGPRLQPCGTPVVVAVLTIKAYITVQFYIRCKFSFLNILLFKSSTNGTRTNLSEVNGRMFVYER